MVLKNCSFQYCLHTDVNIAHSDINTRAIDRIYLDYGSDQHWCTFHVVKTAWLSVAYSTARVCERWRWTFWTPFVTMIALQTVHWIVSFWKIAFLVCCRKQIIISRFRNCTHNLAHNVQMNVSVFSVIFNDFCSVLWVLLYFT